MQPRNLADARRFNPDKMVKSSLFQTERLFYDLYCLEPGQSQKVHSHAASDKVYLVLEGQPHVTIGDEERQLSPNDAVLAAAGQPHGVRNASQQRVVLLVTTTPPPV
jgi:mannose-6-phosphate isomerase-like protein (cupin superfamily)